MPHTDEIIRSAAATLIVVAMPVLAGCGHADAAWAQPGATDLPASAVVRALGAPRKTPPC